MTSSASGPEETAASSGQEPGHEGPTPVESCAMGRDESAPGEAKSRRSAPQTAHARADTASPNSVRRPRRDRRRHAASRSPSTLPLAWLFARLTVPPDPRHRLQLAFIASTALAAWHSPGGMRGGSGERAGLRGESGLREAATSQIATTSRTSGISSFNRASMPIFSVMVELGQPEQAPRRWTSTTPSP